MISGECDVEYIEEVIVGHCLRRKSVIETFHERKPIFETKLPKTPLGRKFYCNRWFADEHGIVIHYPEAIFVCGPDFGSFRVIPVGYKNLQYLTDKPKCHTANLYVTEDLIALEIRKDFVFGITTTVYNRNSLELVYSREDFVGQFYTGRMNKKEELFFKEDHDDMAVDIQKIDKDGGEECVWKGFAYCECRGDLLQCSVYHHKNKVLRHCFLCHIGMLENTDTEEVTEDYQISRRRGPQKLVMNWIDSANILAIEERLAYDDRLRTVSLLDMETGRVELDFESRTGDACRCYAVSQKFFVVCFRHDRFMGPNENKLTNMIVKNRRTGETKEFLVPEFVEKIRTLKLLSGSILVAMPDGSTIPETGIHHERIYTMDLEEEDPRASILSFRVPSSEIQPFGKSKIICKISRDSEDHFKIFDLM